MIHLRCKPLRNSRQADSQPGLRRCLVTWFLHVVLGLGTYSSVSAAPTTDEALRIVKNDCSGCHNPEKKRGGLILTSRESWLRGGENGPVVVPGKPDESRFLRLLSVDADPHMPPKGQLNPDQISALSQWVRDGLTWNSNAFSESPKLEPVSLTHLPSGYQPSLSLAFSPDGARLAVGRGGWVDLYSVTATNATWFRSLEAHADAVQSLAWSPDGRRLVSGGFRRLVLWNAESWNREREWTNGLMGRLSRVRFNRDGSKLVVADSVPAQPSYLRLVSLSGEASIDSWVAHTDAIGDLDLSADGRWAVTGGGDRLVKVWELETRKEVARLEGHLSQVLGVAFNSNATQVVSGGADKELKVWDVATREKLIALGQHSTAISTVAWPQESGSLFAAREDGEVLRYHSLQTHNGEQSSASGQEARVGSASDEVLAMEVSPDRKTVWVTSEDGGIRGWTIEGKTIPIILPQRSAVPAFATLPPSRPVTSMAAISTPSKNSTAKKKPASAGTEPRLQSPASSSATVSIRIDPPVLELVSGAPVHGITVSALSEDGFESDVTTQARFRMVGDSAVELGIYGSLKPLRSGHTKLVASYQGRESEAQIHVRNPEVANTFNPSESPVSFVRDVLPALSKAGCNAGGCHSKPEGQNGFRLSVFSYDPKSDFREIVKEDHGRRVFPSAPDLSLFIQKPTAAIPHEGGMRIPPGSETHRLLQRWMETGMHFTLSNEPVLSALKVFPKERRYRKGAAQRLVVQAVYSDGSMRDVTALAACLSNDKEVVKVDESGSLRIGTLTGKAVIVARYMGFVADSHVLVPADSELPDSEYASIPRFNFIDEFAFRQFQRLGLYPSDLCSDAEFLRRSKLDAIGVLPTASEVRAFLADSSPDKRKRWVDQVLEDPAYADYWANKWADLLRPNPDRVGVKSVFTLDSWLRQSFRENKPFDQFVREILVAEGSNHREGPAVIYRDRREPAELTTMFSQLFLGTRMECAKCHHHPNEKWGQEDFYQLAAYFGPVKQKGAGLSPPISAGRESFYYAPGGAVRHPVTGAVMTPKPPDGDPVSADAAIDPRASLAEWLTGPSNPFFAKASVNRVWAAFFGRGLVEPVDDFRISNPCVNPELLQGLAEDFVQHRYDLKHLMRTLMTSRVYQLSSTPVPRNLADTRQFSRAYRRRLPAEVLLDAVNDATGIPDTFSAMPVGTRAMQAWSYKIDSHFLDAFGRPNSSSDCPCERDLQLSVVQSLHLMNSKSLQSKLSNAQGRAHQLASSSLTPEEIVEELYLSTVNRLPDDAERSTAVAAFHANGATRQSATEDVFWALLNSPEFVFNH